MQEHHISLLQHETEKLHNDIEKMRSELRFVHKQAWKQILGVLN